MEIRPIELTFFIPFRFTYNQWHSITAGTFIKLRKNRTNTTKKRGLGKQQGFFSFFKEQTEASE